VGVVAGAALLGEGISWNQPVGAVVVILGIAIGQGRLAAAFERAFRRRPVEPDNRPGLSHPDRHADAEIAPR
jgi:hypothetical protein